MNKTLWTPFVWWVYGAAIVTALTGMLYLAVQQNYRQNGNDPQMQLAEDAAAKIEAGTQIDQVIPTTKVDITNSLSPWLAFYNNAGAPLLSQGELNGAPPTFPQGLLDSSTWRLPESFIGSNGHKEVYVTWQASDGTRDALVIVQVHSPNGQGYVVAGRNMREIESRVVKLTFEMSIGWAATIFSLLVLSFLCYVFLQR